MKYDFTVALVAHDRMKGSLADFVFDHRAALKGFRLVSTEGTGALVQSRTGLSINLLQHGACGGDGQLGDLAASNEVQAVLFFRDPVTTGAHEPDFTDLLRVCDAHEIPLATNRASAEALLYFLQHSPERGVIGARPWGFVVPAAGLQRSAV